MRGSLCSYYALRIFQIFLRVIVQILFYYAYNIFINLRKESPQGTLQLLALFYKIEFLKYIKIEWFGCV